MCFINEIDLILIMRYEIDTTNNNWDVNFVITFYE